MKGTRGLVIPSLSLHVHPLTPPLYCTLVFVQKSKASGFAAKERERVGMYRQKTKAALVIQLTWRRYIRRKRHSDAMDAQARALQVRQTSDGWVILLVS